MPHCSKYLSVSHTVRAHGMFEMHILESGEREALNESKLTQ